MRSLAGKHAVVTGAGSGIGKAIALALMSEGATVCAVGRNEDKLKALAGSAKAGKLVPFACDLADDGKVESLKMFLSRQAVDVVVHSAGTFSAGPVATAPVAELDEQYRTNVRAAFVLTQALLPQVTQARGQIVLINSSTGLTSRAGVAQYAATKHALRALADGLRDEVNAQGVRVLSVYVGRTATPMQEKVTVFEGKPYRPEQLLQPEDVAECVLNALKMSETAEITDVSIRPMRKT